MWAPRAHAPQQKKTGRFLSRSDNHQTRDGRSAFGRSPDMGGYIVPITSDAFDPVRKSGGPKCCECTTRFFNDVVGCYPRHQESTGRRREFITLVGGAAGCGGLPCAAGAGIRVRDTTTISI